MFKNLKLNLTAVGAAVMIVVAGILVVAFLSAASKTTAVMTASADLSPYLSARSGQLAVTNVPAKSVTSDDLTQAEYQSEYVAQNLSVVPLLTILSGQRIDKRAVALVPEQSFAVVLPDEAVVAVNSSLSGALNGGIKAGDIVDVILNSNSGGSGAAPESNFAKVLCVGTTLADCAGVTPTAAKFTKTKVTDSTATSGPIKVLLAMNKDDAPQFAGQPVAFSLNPLCAFDANGFFVSTRPGKAMACTPPATRAGADKALKTKIEAAAAASSVTGTVTGTATTPTDTTATGVATAPVTTTPTTDSPAVTATLRGTKKP